MPKTQSARVAFSLFADERLQEELSAKLQV